MLNWRTYGVGLAVAAGLWWSAPVLAAITLVGSPVSNRDTDGTVTVTLAAGTAQNDVVYCAVERGGATTDVDMTETSATYTELADLYGNDTEDANLGVYRKVQTATPDTTVELSGVTANVAAVCYTLRGVNTTTPEDATTTTATGINDAVPNPASITTATNGAWVMPLAGNTDPDTGAAPTSYVNFVSHPFPTTPLNNVMAATREIAAFGAEDPGAFTSITGDTSDSWAAATVAVRPAAAAASDNRRRMIGGGVL